MVIGSAVVAVGVAVPIALVWPSLVALIGLVGSAASLLGLYLTWSEARRASESASAAEEAIKRFVEQQCGDQIVRAMDVCEKLLVQVIDSPRELVRENLVRLRRELAALAETGVLPDDSRKSFGLALRSLPSIGELAASPDRAVRDRARIALDSIHERLARAHGVWGRLIHEQNDGTDR